MGVRVLATSRELLRLPGEVTVAISPLAVPDESTSTPADVAASEAVELFSDRAREARSEFRLTEADAPSVAEVCRRLEGHPLRVELAAARLRMLSVGQVAAWCHPTSTARSDQCWPLRRRAPPTPAQWRRCGASLR